MKLGTLRVRWWAVALVVGGLALVGALGLRLVDRDTGGAPDAASPVVAARRSGPPLGHELADGAVTPGEAHPARPRKGAAAPAAVNGPASASIRAARADFGDFRPVGYAGAYPAVAGEYAEAFVRLKSGEGVRLAPNQLGEFQKVYVRPNERASVTVAYAKSAPGTPFIISAQDGGGLKGDKMGSMVRLDDRQRLQFDFTISPGTGTHRVVVRSSSGDLKIFDFWSGEEIVFAGQESRGR